MEELRNPLNAAVAAAVATALFMVVTKPKDKPPSNSYWARPAILVAALVYAIVYLGVGGKEDLIKTPF